MQELMLAMSDWQPILTMSALRTMVMSIEAKSSASSTEMSSKVMEDISGRMTSLRISLAPAKLESTMKSEGRGGSAEEVTTSFSLLL